MQERKKKARWRKRNVNKRKECKNKRKIKKNSDGRKWCINLGLNMKLLQLDRETQQRRVCHELTLLWNDVSFLRHGEGSLLRGRRNRRARGHVFVRMRRGLWNKTLEGGDSDSAPSPHPVGDYFPGTAPHGVSFCPHTSAHTERNCTRHGHTLLNPFTEIHFSFIPPSD